MVESFTAPKTLKLPDGTEYPNPSSCLHLQSAINCIKPSWFEGVPDHLLLSRSKEVPPGDKKCPRDSGKALNFSEIYLSSAQSIAEKNHISLELATEWDNNHKKTYVGYYEWAAEVGNIAAARGYAINARSRWRFVDESNAKGSGESVQRNAVNFMIQGCKGPLIQ